MCCVCVCVSVCGGAGAGALVGKVDLHRHTPHTHPARGADELLRPREPVQQGARDYDWHALAPLFFTIYRCLALPDEPERLRRRIPSLPRQDCRPHPHLPCIVAVAPGLPLHLDACVRAGRHLARSGSRGNVLPVLVHGNTKRWSRFRCGTQCACPCLMVEG